MKKMYTFCDLPLVLATVVLMIVMHILCIWGIVAAPSYTIPSGVFAVQGVWCALLIGFYWGIILLLKETLTFVIFDNEYITLWSPFVGAHKTEYSQYTHIYSSRHFHGSMLCLGSKMPYVVFSQKYLSDKILININQLINSPQTFKIRMRRKRIEELLKLLPPYQARMLQSAMKK